jgi:hypothetical protein
LRYSCTQFIIQILDEKNGYYFLEATIYERIKITDPGEKIFRCEVNIPDMQTTIEFNILNLFQVFLAEKAVRPVFSQQQTTKRSKKTETVISNTQFVISSSLFHSNTKAIRLLIDYE